MTSAQARASLVERIYAAFACAPAPAPEAITPHRCPECDEVRDRLAGWVPRDLPDPDVAWTSDSLPLLGPVAFRYYLPRYLAASILDPAANISDFLLYNLAPEDPEQEFWRDRFGMFSDEERRAIVEYLEHRNRWPDRVVDEQWIVRGIACWSAAGSG